MSMAINNCSKVYPEELSEVAPQSLKPVCLPTARQWKFATLIAAGLISASDAYRLVYPGRGRRQERTVWNHASALARHPKVVWADQASAGRRETGRASDAPAVRGLRPAD